MNKNGNNDNRDANKKISIVVSVFAVFLLIFLIVINKEPLKSFFSVVTSILEPILLGAALAYILNPILRIFEFRIFKKMRNKGLVRALSLIITYIIAIAAFVLIIWVILPKIFDSIIDIGKNYDVYAAEITAFVNKAIENFTSESEFFDPDQLMTLVAEVLADSENLFDTIVNNVVDVGMKLFTIIKNVFLALFISIYMLIGKERLYAKTTKTLKAFLSDSSFKTAMRYAKKANSTFGKFFAGKLLDSVLVFFISIVLLLIFGFPYAILISFIVGTFNLIPFLGIFLGTVASSVIILIADPSKFFIFLLLMVIIQQIDSNIIAPRILGRHTGISSLGVIIAIVIMGGMFGIVGMIIAVPLFAILFTIIKEYAETRLSKKGLKISTVNYYDDPEFSVESKPHRTVVKAFIDAIRKKSKKSKKNNKKDQ